MVGFCHRMDFTAVSSCAARTTTKYFLYATIASAPTTKISSLVNQYDPDTALQLTKGSK